MHTTRDQLITTPAPPGADRRAGAPRRRARSDRRQRASGSGSLRRPVQVKSNDPADEEVTDKEARAPAGEVAATRDEEARAPATEDVAATQDQELRVAGEKARAARGCFG